MNYNRGSEDEEITDSSSEQDYSINSRMEAGNDLYEEVSDSDMDEKESLSRMNDTGVVDVTYAQRTVWLVKVIRFFLRFILLNSFLEGSGFFG